MRAWRFDPPTTKSGDFVTLPINGKTGCTTEAHYQIIG